MRCCPHGARQGAGTNQFTFYCAFCWNFVYTGADLTWQFPLSSWKFVYFSLYFLLVFAYWAILETLEYFPLFFANDLGFFAILSTVNNYLSVANETRTKWLKKILRPSWMCRWMWTVKERATRIFSICSILQRIWRRFCGANCCRKWSNVCRPMCRNASTPCGTSNWSASIWRPNSSKR